MEICFDAAKNGNNNNHSTLQDCWNNIVTNNHEKMYQCEIHEMAGILLQEEQTHCLQKQLIIPKIFVSESSLFSNKNPMLFMQKKHTSPFIHQDNPYHEIVFFLNTKKDIHIYEPDTIPECYFKRNGGRYILISMKFHHFQIKHCNLIQIW